MKFTPRKGTVIATGKKIDWFVLDPIVVDTSEIQKYLLGIGVEMKVDNNNMSLRRNGEQEFTPIWLGAFIIFDPETGEVSVTNRIQFEIRITPMSLDEQIGFDLVLPTTPIKAVRLTEDNILPILGWLLDRGEDANVLDESIAVYGPSGYRYGVRYGQWLVEDEGGILVVNDDVFHTEYRKAD